MAVFKSSAREARALEGKLLVACGNPDGSGLFQAFSLTVDAGDDPTGRPIMMTIGLSREEAQTLADTLPAWLA